MRAAVILLVLVGAVFVGGLVLWPSTPPGNAPPQGYRPCVPDWLAAWLPHPPVAVSLSRLPVALSRGQRWPGRFQAKDGHLGVVRFNLVAGPELRITARQPGQDDQVLCIVADGPASCEEVADGRKGGVVVREGAADIVLEAPRGDVEFVVNGT